MHVMGGVYGSDSDCACTLMHTRSAGVAGSLLSEVLPCPAPSADPPHPDEEASLCVPLAGYIQKIKSGEEDFESLASQFSDCSSAKARGDLGAFSRGAQGMGTPGPTGARTPPRGMTRVALSPGAQQVAAGFLPQAAIFSRVVDSRGGASACLSLLSCPHHRPTEVGARCHFPLLLLRCKAGAQSTSPRILCPEHIPQNPLPALLGGETRSEGMRGSGQQPRPVQVSPPGALGREEQREPGCCCLPPPSLGSQEHQRRAQNRLRGVGEPARDCGQPQEAGGTDSVAGPRNQAWGDQFIIKTHLSVHSGDSHSALIRHAVLRLPRASLIALPPPAAPSSGAMTGP